MRLATILTPNGPRAVVQVGHSFVDLAAAEPSLPATVRGILAAWPEALAKVRMVANAGGSGGYAVADAKYLPPVTDPGKIICIGLNYRDHAIEGGKAIPTEPVVFGKFRNALTAAGDPIVLPRVSQKVDYEAELVVVIGKAGKHIPADRAFEHVAGYTVGHDVSARDWQFKGEERQWIIGKTFDTFGPTGPVLVTADELTDPHNLRVQTRLNGQMMQDSNTREFIFGVPALLAYLSQVMTLEPGDLIFTGTPPGVGAVRKPPVWLKDGDTVEVEIEGIGVLRNPVRREA